MKPPFVFLSFFLMMFLVMGACTQKPQEKEPEKQTGPPVVESRISPLVEGLDVPYFRAELDPSKEHQLTLNNGTRIHIPAGAFLDTNGQAAEGQVELKYREFHHAADILVAGLPMDYQAKGYGKRKPFITAGSFEIRAKDEQGQQLSIDANNPLKVEMGSYKKEDGYQSYYYNQKEQEWAFIGTHSTNPNPRRKALRKTVRKARYQKGWFILSLARALDFRCDTCGYYQARNIAHRFEPIMNKYHVDYANLRPYGEVEYKGNTYPAAELVWKRIRGHSWNRFQNKSANDYSTCSRTYPLDNGLYKINALDCGIENPKKPEVYIVARPVMTLRMLLSKSPDAWNQNYQKTLAQAQKAEQEIQQQAAKLRAFTVRQAGYYNCDRFYDRTDARPVALNIQLPDTGINLSQARSFALVEGQTGIMNLKASQITGTTPVRLPKGAKLKIALLSQKGFCVSKQISSGNQTQLSVAMNNHGKLEKVEDIHRALGLPYRQLALAE